MSEQAAQAPPETILDAELVDDPAQPDVPVLYTQLLVQDHTGALVWVNLEGLDNGVMPRWGGEVLVQGVRILLLSVGDGLLYFLRYPDGIYRHLCASWFVPGPSGLDLKQCFDERGNQMVTILTPPGFFEPVALLPASPTGALVQIAGNTTGKGAGQP